MTDQPKKNKTFDNKMKIIVRLSGGVKNSILSEEIGIHISN